MNVYMELIAGKYISESTGSDPIPPIWFDKGMARSLSLKLRGGGLLCKLERAVIKYFLKINLKFYENSSLECRLSPVMYVG